MFRTNTNVFPVQPNSIPLAGMQNAIMATNGGEYTWALTGAVTERKMVPEGVYIIVPSTY